MRLSKRQIGDADRVGGIQLMILWPEELGSEPEIDRDATPAEKAYAEALLREQCALHNLVPVHTRVTRVVRPTDPTMPDHGEMRAHLAVTLIGQRWVHASTRNRGRIAWAR